MPLLSPTTLLASLGALPGTGIMLPLLILMVLVLLVILVLMLVSTWKLYEKAGEKGWSMLIPFYGQAVFMRIVKKPLWWLLLLLIPVVNIVLWVMLSIRFAKFFGKSTWFGVGCMFLPFIFLPMLAFSDATYNAGAFDETNDYSQIILWSVVYGILSMISSGISSAFQHHS